ncbi:MAG TPA: DUF2752 domain-containing protein [Verrucomicrobiae bacterium]|nr:DUF2752 domain-containing protein [Verrucomicrobiae bacterium]
MHTGSDSTRINLPASRILPVSAVILCAAVAGVYFLFDPTKVSIFPPCIFHQVTGLDCPGCGGQRALHELLHGHLIAALQMNAMFVLSLPLAAWFLPRFISRAVRGTPMPPLNTLWLCVYAAAWIIFGIVRNLPFPWCHWFAA